MRIFSADFETTTEETCANETWVWAYGIRELFKENSFKWGTRIEDFFKWCEKGGSKLVYYHNLKFDGFFLLDYLLNHNFEWVDKSTSKKSQPNTFTTLITKDGLFYEIEVIFSVYKKNVKKVIFRDSYKKLPFTVDRIAKSFKLDYLKGDIDYKKVRPKGYQPTKEEIDYLFRDVEIVAQALEIQYNEGQDGMTIGSDSLKTFKNIIGKRQFERLFPVLSEDTDSFIRKSYKGGFTYLNPKYLEKLVMGGRVYDVNSLYPAMMLKPLPYGTPLKYEGKYERIGNYNLYIQKLTCEFYLKEGFLPTIQIKGNPRFKATEYLTSSKGEPTELWLTSVDLELFFEHYDVMVYSYDGGYMFKQVEGIFKDYISQFMKIKEVSEGAVRELAKLLLNNLYGKFATSTDATGKTPKLNEEGVVELVEGEERLKPSIYTAVGSFITSYARETTIRTAQENYDRFIYADTDSCHIEGMEEPTNMDIHPTRLGAWKHEYDFTEGKFLRAKTYAERYIKKDGSTELKIVCAGMPDKLKQMVTMDNFNRGESFHGKLVPKVVKGGVILVETDFTIKL